MACFRPIKAFQKFGRGRLIFSLPKEEPSFFYRQCFAPCHKCIGCRIDHSREWALRCVNEASLHKHNCFITLTFNNEHLPKCVSVSTGELIPTLDPSKDIMRKFWNRLRKKVSYYGLAEKIRYYYCGEYGFEFNRPHYHAIIFGFDFPDKYEWYPDFATKFRCLKNHVKMYRSPILEDLWCDPDTGESFGFSTVGEVTYEACAYVARYIMKKHYGDDSDAFYDGRFPEYTQSSTGRHSKDPEKDDGGIGYRWFKKFKSDVFPDDFCLYRTTKTKRLIKLRPPRYYEAIYDTIDPEALKEIKAKRRRYIQHNSRYEAEHSPERLAVKEELLAKRTKKLIRSFEVISGDS